MSMGGGAANNNSTASADPGLQDSTQYGGGS